MTFPIIWQTPKGDSTTFEFEWITEDLFSELQPQERYFDHGKYKTVINNAIIVYSNNSKSVSPEFLNYLDKFKQNNYTFYLLHLSDENLQHDCSYYALATHVFRNYYDPKVNYPSNVTIIPLGYKSGYKNYSNKIMQLSDRKIPACFIGQVKSDRIDVVKALNTVPESFLHLTKQWNCSTALDQKQVSEIYSKTRFVPCPQGWCHIDSFRIFEALEWGSIPVLRNYGATKQLGWIGNNHPLPVIDSWNEIPNLIQTTNYKILQERCQEWYKSIKLKYAKHILEIIKSL